MATTLTQQMALAIAPKFTAAASVFGSTMTLYLILHGRGAETTKKSRQKKRTYHRLVLGMSCCDLSASIAWFFTTWPIPKETGVFGAVGNQQTCSAQAFFAQFSLSTIMYNASLAIYYVLVIVKQWSDEDILRIEPFLHFNALLWGLGTGIASLVLGIFNHVGWDCWISSSPLGCQESWNSVDGKTTTCIRGDNGSLYQWAFYYGPLWFVIVLVALLMYWVYITVKRQEEKVNQYIRSSVTIDDHDTTGKRRKLSSAEISHHKRIRDQALYYVGAFLLTWFFPTVFQIVIVTTNTFPYPLLFLTALFVPIQGLLNLIVFLRLSFMRYRIQHPEEFILIAWFRMLWQELTIGSTTKQGASHYSTNYNENNSNVNTHNSRVVLTSAHDACAKNNNTKVTESAVVSVRKDCAEYDVEEEEYYSINENDNPRKDDQDHENAFDEAITTFVESEISNHVTTNNVQ